ncbi:MAG: TRAP transporter small permease [Clostridiales bacterium]|nr:TRAP transporter small permease [Clostridiales bacterium]
MTAFIKIDRLFSKFLEFLNSIAALIVAAIMLIITADVVARTVFSSPFQGVSEVVANSIIILCFLEISYALMKGSLVRTSLVYDKVPVRVKCVIDFLAAVLGIVVFVLLIKGSWPNFLSAWAINDSEVAGSVRIPTTPGRFSVIFGSAVMVIEFVFIAIKSLIRLKHPDMFAKDFHVEENSEGAGT